MATSHRQTLRPSNISAHRPVNSGAIHRSKRSFIRDGTHYTIETSSGESRGCSFGSKAVRSHTVGGGTSSPRMMSSFANTLLDTTFDILDSLISPSRSQKKRNLRILPLDRRTVVSEMDNDNPFDAFDTFDPFPSLLNRPFPTMTFAQAPEQPSGYPSATSRTNLSARVQALEATVRQLREALGTTRRNYRHVARQSDVDIVIRERARLDVEKFDQLVQDTQTELNEARDRLARFSPPEQQFRGHTHHVNQRHAFEVPPMPFTAFASLAGEPLFTPSPFDAFPFVPVFGHFFHSGNFVHAHPPFNMDGLPSFSPSAVSNGYPSNSPSTAHSHAAPSFRGSPRSSDDGSYRPTRRATSSAANERKRRHTNTPAPSRASSPKVSPRMQVRNTLTNAEAKRCFLAYDEHWTALHPNNADIPYPSRDLQKATLLDKHSIEVPSRVSNVTTWSDEMIMKANVQAFFLRAADLTPRYHEHVSNGRIVLDFDRAKATLTQLERLVDSLKKERRRWHSDRLGRRNDGASGANVTLQSDECARAVFHAVCELIEVASECLEEALG